MADIKKEIRKFALSNAYEHKGKAQTGPIIGKLISLGLMSADKIKTIVPQINEIIKEVNKLGYENQEKELKKIHPEFFKKEKKEETLKELPNTKEGKVVTRMPPEPSKYIHVGHALSFLINYLYAKKYRGKCILRFEDTNPEKATQEYVDSIKDDLFNYLKIKPDKIVYESEDIPKMYKYAERLIKANKAYVCFCSREKVRKLRNNEQCCECRASISNLKEWKNMLNGKYKEGEATLRLKIDMCCPNTAMRDPAIFRISTKKHYKQGNKYKVWPLYDFAAAVEEEACGITHVLRSSEFGTMRIELQNWISEQLGFKKKTFIQYGRFNIAGAITQGREIRELIKKKKVSGWDDPSLVTLKALRRRGIHPKAFEKLAIRVGLSKTETKIDWSMIAAENRKIIDPISNRYFFVENPVKIKVAGLKNTEVKIKVHPDKKEYRRLKVTDEFYIPKKDKGSKIRLKDYIKIEKGKLAVDQSLDSKIQKIQWVPAKENIKVEVLMPDKSIKKGLAEINVNKLKEGEVIQFERFGFCRLDKKSKNKLIFVFGHN